MFNFDLQLFGGGKGGSTTTVAPTPPTAQELRLQDVQANFAEKTAPNALRLQQTGSDMLYSNPGIVPVDYTKMGQQAVAGAQGLQNSASNLQGNINDLYGVNSANLAEGKNLINGLNTTNTNNLASGTQAYTGLTGNQNSLNTNNANSMTGLMNGQLPQAYADAQQYAINRGTQTALGNLLAQKAASGTIGGTSYDRGIQGISDSVANTMSQNYNQNMAQALGAQNQNANQQQTGQNALRNIANDQVALNQQGYINQAGNADRSINLNQQAFNNQSNVNNTMSQNIEQQRGLLSQPMELLNSAQNASIDIPNKLLAMSRGEMANTSNLWQNMAQQRIASTPQVYQTQGSGGLFGDLLGGVGAFYGAKAR